MSASIRKFGPKDSPDTIVAEIRENGVVVVEDVFQKDDLERLKAIVDVDLEKQEVGTGDKTVFATGKRSLTALFGRGVEFSETLLLNDRVLELMDRVLLPEVPMASTAKPKPAMDPSEAYLKRLTDPSYPHPHVGPNCHHYRINASVAMQVIKGGENQQLHCDQFRYLPYMLRDPAGPELTMAVMVAVSDFTRDNGATRFIPGSNKWPYDRFPKEHEVVQAEMSQGSAAFWLGSVYHGYGASTVDEPRTGFIFSYGLDHLAQEENQFMAVPPAVAKDLPLKARQLLGYRSSPVINWAEGLDKDDMLKEGQSSLFF